MRVVFVLRPKGEDRELLNGEELLQLCRQWKPSQPRLSTRLMASARQHANHGVWFTGVVVGDLGEYVKNLTLTATVLSSALQAADRAKGGAGDGDGAGGVAASAAAAGEAGGAGSVGAAASAGAGWGVRGVFNGTWPLDGALLDAAGTKVESALHACHIRKARAQAVLTFLEARVAEAVAEADLDRQHGMMDHAGKTLNPKP